MKADILSPHLPISTLGEAPIWDVQNDKLYWVDIEERVIHCCDSEGEQYQACKVPHRVGFVVPEADHILIAGLSDGLYRIDFKKEEVHKIETGLNMPPETRFNDGKCDRRGRLWGGTINEASPAQPAAALYRMDQEILTPVEKNIYIANGLAWSPANTRMYFNDTAQSTTWVYDYDIETGIPRNRRVFHKYLAEGKPDGMCVDSAGRIFTALWSGWGVEIYTKDGQLDQRIDLPVPQVTSCAFGGPDLKTLYITTARKGLSETALKGAPLSGYLFAIRMDIPGIAEEYINSHG